MVVLKVIPGEGISETPGNLLEMQTLMPRRSHQHLPNQKLWVIVMPASLNITALECIYL